MSSCHPRSIRIRSVRDVASHLGEVDCDLESEPFSRKVFDAGRTQRRIARSHDVNLRFRFTSGESRREAPHFQRLVLL